MTKTKAKGTKQGRTRTEGSREKGSKGKENVSVKAKATQGTSKTKTKAERKGKATEGAPAEDEQASAQAQGLVAEGPTGDGSGEAGSGEAGSGEAGSGPAGGEASADAEAVEATGTPPEASSDSAPGPAPGGNGGDGGDGANAGGEGSEPEETKDEPRLPPVGTVIRKVSRDGTVRCECTVEPDDKIGYKGTLYTSLSGAAAAAAGDLGLTSKSLNGWVWWGLVKPARKDGESASGGGRDPVKLLDTCWTKMRGRLNELLSDELTDEARSKLMTAVLERANALAAVARAALGDDRAA